MSRYFETVQKLNKSSLMSFLNSSRQTRIDFFNILAHDVYFFDIIIARKKYDNCCIHELNEHIMDRKANVNESRIGILFASCWHIYNMFMKK